MNYLYLSKNKIMSLVKDLDIQTIKNKVSDCIIEIRAGEVKNAIFSLGIRITVLGNEIRKLNNLK